MEKLVVSNHQNSTRSPKMSSPKYLTGDVAAVNEFIDKFDVSDLHTAHTA